MANGRCRMHGGASTGPRTAEGLARLRAARTRHAPQIAEALAFNRTCRQLIQRANTLLALAKAKAAERQAIDRQTLLPSLVPAPPGPPLPSRHRCSGKTRCAVRTTQPTTQADAADALPAGSAFRSPPTGRAATTARQNLMRREALIQAAQIR